MIDFSHVKPAAVDISRAKQPQTRQSLFEFEVVEIYERKLRESPKAASRLNDVMAKVIAVLLFLMPVPYGANRPLAWLAAIFLIGVLSAVYFAMIAQLDPNRPTQFRNYRWVVFPGLAAIVWSVIQIIPIGGAALSETVSATALAIPRMVSYALLFILISEVCTNRVRTEKLVTWVFYGIVAHAVWALLSLSVFGDTLLFQAKTTYEGFATGTFINRNSFATYMGMGVVIGAAMVLFEMRSPARRSPNRKSRVKGFTTDAAYTTILVFVVFAALLASGSRLGLASTIVGAWATIVLTLLKTGISRIRVIIGSAAAAVIGGAVLAVMFGQSLLQRLVFLFVDSETRIELYRQTLTMIGDRWATGFGLDSYEIAFHSFHLPTLSTSYIWDKPHNTYLTLWSELGVIAGSLPMLSVLIAFVMVARSVFVRERSYFPAAAATGVIVLGAMHSLGDFSLEIAANTYVFVAIVALGLARRSRAREY